MFFLNNYSFLWSDKCSCNILLYDFSDVVNSDVVLEARPWPPGASRPNFMALALVLASGPVALALASKVQALALALRAVLTIFGITLKLK